MSNDYVIGIDLGTTNSCVAVWRNGRIEIIPNDIGLNNTPSYVSFTETERYVGQLAKDNAIRNPADTIYDTKRLIGRKMDDITIREDMKHWSFKVTGNQSNQPLITAKYRDKCQKFHPEEISAMILERMKSYAEDFLGQKIFKAVITVPAYFNDSQRQATSDAAKIAGLNCVRIINEPTAAALAYGLDKKCLQEEIILIYDLGGGTLDVSLLAIENGTFEVIATSGDSHLGGEDFDNRMVNFMCDEFNRINKNHDIRTNQRALRKIKTACEKAKMALSTSMRSVIEIDSLHDGIDFSVTLNRSKFEELCMDLFKKCLNPVQQVLDDAKVMRNDIKEVVLVGGSTRIPFVQKQLKEFFNGKELNKSVHPDEAVAYGAAIQGSILSQMSDNKTDDIILLDVTPLSLGVETAGGLMSPIIERNTSIPCTMKELYTTYTDNQKAVSINIFEGERQMTKYNNKLGQFDLIDIAPAQRGAPQIEVTFDIDNNGILTVSAMDITGTSRNQIQIVKNKGRLSDPEISKLIEDAERYRKDDIEMKKMIEARNKIESMIYQIKSHLSNPEIERNISIEEKSKLTSATNTLRAWLDEHPTATMEEYDQNKAPLELIRNIVFTRVFTGIPLHSSLHVL